MTEFDANHVLFGCYWKKKLISQKYEITGIKDVNHVFIEVEIFQFVVIA